MNEQEYGKLYDAVNEIHSLSEVGVIYSDKYEENENMFHIGLIIDKINEQALILKSIINKID